MKIDVKAFLAKNNEADQVVAPHLRAIILHDARFKKVQPITQKVREIVHDCNNPRRHWVAQNNARRAIDLLKTCRLATPGCVGHYRRISTGVNNLVTEVYQQAVDCNARLDNPALNKDITLEDVASACAVVKVLMMGKKIYYPIKGHLTEDIVAMLSDATDFMADMSNSLTHFEESWMRVSAKDREEIIAQNRTWLFVLNKTFEELPFSPTAHFINITRHWLEKLAMPANVDDRRKLVQLRNSFPKDAFATQKASDSMLA